MSSSAKKKLLLFLEHGNTVYYPIYKVLPLILGVMVVHAKFKCTKCHQEIACTEPYFHVLGGINQLISVQFKCRANRNIRQGFTRQDLTNVNEKRAPHKTIHN